MFFVGQKVTMKDNRVWNLEGRPRGEVMPVFGVIYTIRDIVHRDWLDLRFKEIVNQPHEYSNGRTECAFRAEYFRPVTDIGWAHKLVKEVKNMSPKDMERV